MDLVIYYDDVTPAVYEWVKSLPVAAISLDFCSSPGAAHGCDTAAIIAAHGFPKVCTSTADIPIFSFMSTLTFSLTGYLPTGHAAWMRNY